jgi:hypothetical protein
MLRQQTDEVATSVVATLDDELHRLASIDPVKLITSVPAPLIRAWGRRGGRLSLHDSIEPKDYPRMIEPSS